MAARKRVLDYRRFYWYTSEEGYEAAAAGSPDAAHPFAVSTVPDTGVVPHVANLKIDLENVNAIESEKEMTVSQEGLSQRLSLPASSPADSRLERREGVCFELDQVRQLMLGLGQQLQSASDLFGDNVSGLGMALARLEALEAGFSELLASEAQDQGEFSDDY